MRTTVLPSMLEILVRNYNYRNKSVRLYELGRTYALGGEDGLAIERKVLSLGAYGGGMDFFSLKGLVEAVLDSIRAKDVSYKACRTNPSYHPGRCAEVYVGDRLIGVFGQIHPLLASPCATLAPFSWPLLSGVALMAPVGEDPTYVPLPRFPAVTRDIALVCDAGIPVAELKRCIMENGGEYLVGCNLFDIYTGSHIADGKKSVAFSLTMRAKDQTLTDEHAEETVANVLSALAEKPGAIIR